MGRRGVARWGGGLLFLLALAGAAVDRVAPVQRDRSTSFPGYWAVAREVAAGTPVVALYDEATLFARMQAQGVPVRERLVGPPTVVLTMLPLAPLPYERARQVFLWGVSLPALAGSLWALRAWAGPVRGAVLGAAVLLSAPAAAGFAVGQVYTVFLALHVLALGSAGAGRGLLAGLCLAPMVASRGWVGLPVGLGLGLAGRPAVALGTVGGAALLCLASVPVVGVDAWRHFFTTHLSQAATDPWAGTPAYQTLRSLCLHLFEASPLWGPAPPLPMPGAGPVAFLGLALAIVGATLAALRRRPPLPVAMALLLPVQLLLGPAAEDYHFVLAALPLAVLLGRGGGPALLALLAAPLLLLDLAYEDPALLGGWASLRAYPRVYGTIFLLAGGLWAAWRTPG